VGNARNMVFWVVLFLLIVALFNLFSNDPATTASSRISYSEFISRVENGKIVEEWEQFDEVEMMKQLGVLPP